MKGLVISLAIFVSYVLATMLLAHFLRPQRHFKLFGLSFLAFSVFYFALYALTPKNCFILPETFLSPGLWLDMILGYAILLLNCHSYIDCFYGFNGGFSSSLILALWRTGDRGAGTEELLRLYFRANGTDKIVGWRLPDLEASGYIRSEQQTGLYQLTLKGRVIARLTLFLKRVLNLGAGG